MKILLVLLDGLGDRAFKVLDHRTPLQAAFTPNLDRIASLGSNGLFHAASPGMCLPSETAHYLLFGYALHEFPGRGLLEGVGYHIPFEDRDVLSLAHFSSVTWEGEVPVLTHSRRDIKGDASELNRLYACIADFESEGVRLRLHRTQFNDAVLVMSGEVSPYVCDPDPMIIGRPMAEILPLEGNSEPDKAARTARVLTEYLSSCHGILKDHEINLRRRDGGQAPANFLAVQRCGRRVLHGSFRERWDLEAMLIGSGAVYEGLAHELGMDFVAVKDGEDAGKDLRERIDVALADEVHDFIHVHTKVPDEAAHTGDPVKKLKAVESLDRGLDSLASALGEREDLLIAVTADHSTASVSSLIHSGEPVPVAIVGPEVRRDHVSVFDEVSAASGCLGFLRDKELLLMLLNYADRSSLVGHRVSPEETLYAPRKYRPFRLVEGKGI
jgi:2,3-bisphosphoglycerate-independent phosphoglycerate mutase